VATTGQRWPDKLVAEYLTLAENSPDIVDRFDREFRHIYDNPAGLRVLGLPREKVIGKTIRETGVPEPWASLWEERIRTVFATGQPLDVEDTFPTPSGLGFFQSCCVPKLGEDGTVRSILVVSRDITARKKAEEAARAAAEQYRRLIETTNEGIVITDPEGRITFVNQQFADMLGYERGELLGRNTLEFIGDEADREVVLKARAAVRAGGRLQGEFRYRRKDGKVGWSLVSVSPVTDESGRVV